MKYVTPLNQTKVNNIVNVTFGENNQNFIHDFSNFVRAFFKSNGKNYH